MKSILSWEAYPWENLNISSPRLVRASEVTHPQLGVFARDGCKEVDDFFKISGFIISRVERL